MNPKRCFAIILALGHAAFAAAQPVPQAPAVAIQFGGCDGKISNCLPTVPGWNYMVRLFRPRAEVLNGKWKFPEAQLVN